MLLDRANQLGNVDWLCQERVAVDFEATLCLRFGH